MRSTIRLPGFTQMWLMLSLFSEAVSWCLALVRSTPPMIQVSFHRCFLPLTTLMQSMLTKTCFVPNVHISWSMQWNASRVSTSFAKNALFSKITFVTSMNAGTITLKYPEKFTSFTRKSCTSLSLGVQTTQMGVTKL